MTANAAPRFTRQANIGQANVDAANTASDGTGNITTPTMYVIFTPDATNGSFLEAVRVAIAASAASTASAATVIRLYLSTQSTGATTNANTKLFWEEQIPAQTADQATTALPVFDIPIGWAIPAGLFVLASTHVAANANTHYQVIAIGGDY